MVNKRDYVSGEFYRTLAIVFSNHDIEDDDLKLLADHLSEKAVSARQAGSKELVTIKKLKGKNPEVIYYSPREAARLIASACAAVANPTSVILLGAAVLSCGIALRGLRQAAPPGESALFWLICNCENQQVSREEASRLFLEYCQNTNEVRLEDFAPALQGLLKSGFLREEGNVLQVVKVILRVNLPSLIDP